MTPRTLALALAAPFLWGTSFTLAKPTVAQFPPLLFMAFCYSIVLIMILATERRPLKTPWYQALAIASLGVTIQGGILFWAVKYVDSTTSNLVLQTQVPAAVFLGWLIIGEEVTRAKIIGTVIAIAGVAIIIGLPEQRPPLLPVLGIMVSGSVWALSQVLVRKWSRDDGALVLKSNALYGLPQLIICTLMFETGQWQAVASATPLHWLMLLCCGFFGFYLAYMCWFSLLRQLPVDEAVPFVLLMTPVGIVTAVLFLGETMSAVQIFGAVVLMLGLAIVNGIGQAKAA